MKLAALTGSEFFCADSILERKGNKSEGKGSIPHRKGSIHSRKGSKSV